MIFGKRLLIVGFLLAGAVPNSEAMWRQGVLHGSSGDTGYRRFPELTKKVWEPENDRGEKVGLADDGEAIGSLGTEDYNRQVRYIIAPKPGWLVGDRSATLQEEAVILDWIADARNCVDDAWSIGKSYMETPFLYHEEHDKKYSDDRNPVYSEHIADYINFVDGYIPFINLNDFCKRHGGAFKEKFNLANMGKNIANAKNTLSEKERWLTGVDYIAYVIYVNALIQDIINLSNRPNGLSYLEDCYVEALLRYMIKGLDGFSCPTEDFVKATNEQVFSAYRLMNSTLATLVDSFHQIEGMAFNGPAGMRTCAIHPPSASVWLRMADAKRKYALKLRKLFLAPLGVAGRDMRSGYSEFMKLLEKLVKTWGERERLYYSTHE